MEPQIKPSIRKQFLSRIYQRNPVVSPDLDLSEKSSETYQQEKSFASNLSDISTTTDPKVLHETQCLHSSTTSIHLSRKNSTPGNDVENMQVFIDFLKNLQDSNGEFSFELMQRVFPVTKALNDNFSKNPEFSLQFYISMTGIINALEDPESISFPEFKEKIEEALRLTNEGITEIEQLTSLKKHMSKVSLKIITVRFI